LNFLLTSVDNPQVCFRLFFVRSLSMSCLYLFNFLFVSNAYLMLTSSRT
jgi:hypothetical protein